MFPCLTKCSRLVLMGGGGRCEGCQKERKVKGRLFSRAGHTHTHTHTGTYTLAQTHTYQYTHCVSGITDRQGHSTARVCTWNSQTCNHIYNKISVQYTISTPWYYNRLNAFPVYPIKTRVHTHSALKPEVRGTFCIKFQNFKKLVSLDKKWFLAFRYTLLSYHQKALSKATIASRISYMYDHIINDHKPF